MRENPTIPEDFPHSMSDKALEECIKGYMDAIIQEEAQENVVIQNYPLVSLGQYELQKRQNKRIIKFTTGISAVSLLVAITALYIAFTNSHSSERWESNQIKILQSISRTIETQNDSIIEISNKTEKLEKEKKNKLTVISNQLMAIEKNTANKALNSDAQKARAR